MESLFEVVKDVIEPLCGIGGWYGISPSLYGHNPDAPAIWSLTCHRCLHHGLPDRDDAGIWCEACGELFWTDPQKSTGELVPRRQVVQDAAWVQQMSQTYIIRDVERLKEAYLVARAKHQEWMARLMRPCSREGEKTTPPAHDDARGVAVPEEANAVL